MKIEVAQLEQGPLQFDERLILDPERLSGDPVASPIEVRLEGEVRPRDGLFSILGRFRATGELSCSRCLEPVSWNADEQFCVEFRRPLDGEPEQEIGLDDDELDVAFLDGDALDLTDLAVEQVLLALPIRVLCREDCAGLCPQCGANRNLPDACSCEPEIDPRWQALAELAKGGPEN